VSEEALTCTSPWCRSKEMSLWPCNGAVAYNSCSTISELPAGALKMLVDGIEETVRAVGA